MILAISSPRERPIQAIALPRPFVDFVRLGRPQFLIGGFLMHGLGLATARAMGVPIDLTAALWCQITITAIQLMTHFCNEYFDQEADRANPTPTGWAGGSRVLIEGRIDPRIALWTAVALGILSLKAAFVLAFVIRQDPALFLALVTALGLAWSYSAPPLRLQSRGLGELDTAFLVPFLVTLIGFYVQAGRVELLPILVVVPLCFLQFGMQLLIEFADEVGDRAAGKDTLVVRLGGAGAARLYMVSLAAAYAVLPGLVVLGLPLEVAFADALGLPVALYLGWDLSHGAWANPARWDPISFLGITLLVGTATADMLAMLLRAGF